MLPPFVSEIKGKINKEIVDDINKKKPDVVWVGLSAPKQEKWISDNIFSVFSKSGIFLTEVPFFRFKV